MSLSEWTSRHNRWSDAEVDEIFKQEKRARDKQIQPRLFGNAIERRISLRHAYYRAPIFLRALGLFIYRYVLKLGFLDGKPGLILYFLQAFWFRFLIDAKIYERIIANPINKPFEQ